MPAAAAAAAAALERGCFFEAGSWSTLDLRSMPGYSLPRWPAANLASSASSSLQRRQVSSGTMLSTDGIRRRAIHSQEMSPLRTKPWYFPVAASSASALITYWAPCRQAGWQAGSISRLPNSSAVRSEPCTHRRCIGIAAALLAGAAGACLLAIECHCSEDVLDACSRSR